MADESAEYGGTAMMMAHVDEEESVADGEPGQRRRPGQDNCTHLAGEIRRLHDHFNDVLQKLRDESKAIHQEKAEIGLVVDKERQQMKDSLAGEWSALERERAQLKAMSMKAAHYADDKFVRLNVGGKVFTTTVATLRADSGSMLAAMFSEAFHVERNENDEVVIDRDPKHFELIIEHLRQLRAESFDGSLTTDHRSRIDRILHHQNLTEEDRREVLAEAEFYGLQRLQQALQHSSLIVSQEGNSRYKRVSEALQDARDGDRVLVKPGIYYDSFTLLHNVEVIGDGPRESITIRSPFNNVVECRCHHATVRGLTLECFPPDAASSDQSMYGDFYGVFISEGSLTLEDCEVRCVGLSCVKVVGGPKAGVSVIRRNDIHAAHQCGILLANYAEALIQHNAVHHNRFSGVEIRNGARPKLQANRIYENVQNGVYIHSHGEGLVEGNHLYKNKFNGINGEGNVVVSNNVIHENLKRGIFYGAQMTLQSNEVYWNALGDFAPRR